MKHPLQDRTRVPAWLADDYLDSYIVWREECAAVRDAYECWQRGGQPEAFAAYRAVLDREERAAQLLQAHVERVHGWLA